MTRLILTIYDFMRRRTVAWCIFAAVTAALAASVLRLNYQENIADFLPLDRDNATAMSVYSDISGADNVYAVVSCRGGEVNPELLAEGIDMLAENVTELDTAGFVTRIIAEIDPIEQMQAITGKLYTMMPLLLTDSDYDRIDSLLSQPGYVDRRVADNRAMLLMPTSGMFTTTITHDPLGLFTPVMERIAPPDMSANYATYDGYILSPDSTRAFVVFETAGDPNDSGRNAALVDLLEQSAQLTAQSCPGIEIDFTGAPVIAVGNARCIKHDSLWSVIVAGLVIMALLIYVFRNARNILLIFISVAWGWLFAMGAIAIVYDSVSIIVVGIASIMLGIAVNYPLHLIDHLSDATNRREALRSIIAPLVIGNITTVGAFLCLVPLESPALHDLGIFGSMLLVGTILFVLIFLPHAVKSVKQGNDEQQRQSLLTRIASLHVGNNRITVPVLAALTLLFAWFSQYTAFDPDLRNINYLTNRQQQLFDELNATMGTKTAHGTIYIVSSGATADSALTVFAHSNRIADSLALQSKLTPVNELDRFLVTAGERAKRLDRWQQLAQRSDSITRALDAAAMKSGFRTESFAPFAEMLRTDYSGIGATEAVNLARELFFGSVSTRNGNVSIVRAVKSDISVAELKDALPEGATAFDIDTISRSMTDTLAIDFNYIGLACGCIVFLFLWLSMGRIELAIISFLPMAISWIWILGIMGMLDLRFNIVNIILATFIFGQGDDYTIFITEGLSYEYAYGRRVVTRYKSNIIVSAVLMFAGIGTLAFAAHPAMRSLGQVTIVGMLSVVLMACIVPPLAFNFLTRHRNGTLRRRPLSIGMLFGRKSGNSFDEACETVRSRYLYKGVGVWREACHRLKEVSREGEQAFLHRGTDNITVNDPGNGEIALLTALLNQQATVTAVMRDADSADLLATAAKDLCSNLTIERKT